MFCPSCGENLTEAPSRLGDRWCEYCGTASSPRACLLALSREARLSRPLGDPPTEVVISHEGGVFLVSLAHDGTNAAFSWVMTVVFAFVMFAAVLSFGPVLGWVIPALYVSALLVMSWLAIRYTFGRDTLAVDSRTLTIGRSLGRWNEPEDCLDRHRIKSCQLLRKPRSRGRYRDLPGFLIRFELDDGRHIDFGFGHDYPQLAFVMRWLRDVARIA